MDLRQPVICRTHQASILLSTLTYVIPIATKGGGKIDVFMVISFVFGLSAWGVMLVWKGVFCVCTCARG